MQLATNSITVESTAWILTLKRLNRPLPLPPVGETRLDLLQVAEHRPEQLLDEVGTADLVGVRQRVTGRWSHSEARQRPGLEPQPVTDIVQPHRAGELRKDHRGQMARHTEGAGLGLNSGLDRQAVDHSTRNEVEKLLENDHIAPGWCGGIHFTLPSGRDFTSTPARFYSFDYVSLWDGCGFFSWPLNHEQTPLHLKLSS